MNRLKKIPCYFLLLTFLLCSCGDESPTFLNNWDEDVYYFAKNLEDNHVDLFFNVSKQEFYSDIESLRMKTDSLSKVDILIELSKIIAKIGDSHTQFVFQHELTALPFTVQWLDDGLFLDRVSSGNSEFLGSEITAINSIPIADIIDNFRTVIPFENESNFKNQFVTYSRLLEYYSEFDIVENPSYIQLNLASGGTCFIEQNGGEIIEFMPPKTPLFKSNPSTIYWFQHLPEENMVYIQYNSCQERSDLSFEDFTQQITTQLNENLTIDKIAIDLRHNGGGNSTIMHPLINALEDLVNENRIEKEHIYLIIGRKTFSSAILNTIEIKEKIDNIIIGEPSGGKPNHYGEVRSFRLPNSNLQVTYSTKYFTHSEDDGSSIIPDVIVPYNSTHLFEGLDPVLERIIED
ncbi:MAG: hypothetical protein P1U56_09010 [Saprospiraceae bacterium]|nr:hypothetical protein [Saprospiraceae bacterium]